MSHDGVIFARGYVHCLQCGRQYSGIGTFLQLLPDKECGYRLFRPPDNKQVNNAITASGYLKNPPVLIITGVYLFFRNKYSGGVHNYAADSYILKLHYFNNRFLTSLFICLWHIRSEICVTLSVLYYCLRRSWQGR